MTVGRNAPCPCGSGRKYKQCCQNADAQAKSGSDAGTARREAMARRAREGPWDVDAVALPVDIGGGGKHRPVSILLAAGELVINANVRDRLSGEPDAIAEAFAQEILAELKRSGSNPGRVFVRHPELRDPLQHRLSAHGITVEVAPRLESEPAARALIHHLSGVWQWPPVSIADSWSAWRLPADTVRDLFAAAAEYWRRAPWKVIANEQTPEATFPSGRVWTAGVMGMAGVETGLALYSESVDLYSITDPEEEDEALGEVRGRIVTLSFEPRANIPPPMRAEARTSGWEVADPRAFPVLLTINTPGGGVTRAEIEELAAMLRAIPEFAKRHAQDLLLEQKSGQPSGVLTWEDPAGGLLLRYDSEAAHARAAAVGWDEDDPFLDDDDLDPSDETDVRRLFGEVLDVLGPDAELEEVFEHLNEHGGELMNRISDLPREEFGGLSPRQLPALIYSDWTEVDSPVVVNRSLPISRIAGSSILADTRNLLRYAAQRGGIPATAAGNLAMSAVRELNEECGYDLQAGTDARSRRVREIDVAPLHVSRVLLELAGILACEKRRFVITEAGAHLLNDGAAGELYALLFITRFQRFNLDYLSFVGWPALQEQAAYTLYRLATRKVQWETAQELLPDVVLDAARELAPTLLLENLAGPLLEQRILHTLTEFDLLEFDNLEPEDAQSVIRYRATPLLRDFLSFRL